MKPLIRVGALAGVLSLSVAGCGSNESSFSILPSAENFQQSSEGISTKIDVLWVVDNSGSMASSQQNLVDNFTSFIESFIEKNYDFRIGIVTTDAFLATPKWQSFYDYVDPFSGLAFKDRYFSGLDQNLIAQLRDGIPGEAATGVKIIDNNTPNLIEVFRSNALQGTRGYGDERAFESIEVALTSPLNAEFRRSDAFLAIVLVTDEDDFSYDGLSFTEDLQNPELHPVSRYVNYLNELTGSTDEVKNYNVSTLSINDSACLAQLADNSQKIGVRVAELATQTGGVVGNLCGDFAEEVRFISDRIVELSTLFYLNREPIVESLRVFVNGLEVPRAEGNGGAGGWTYVASSNAVSFSGEFIPGQAATIQVQFDPASLGLE